MTAHWKKKSLARLVPRELFQVSNELGQISPLECATASGLASLRIPWTFPLGPRSSNTAWFEHLIWRQKENKSPGRSDLTGTSPNRLPPFFFHFQRESLWKCDKVSWVLKVQLWKANPPKGTVRECSKWFEHTSGIVPLVTEQNDSVSLKKNCKILKSVSKEYLLAEHEPK